MTARDIAIGTLSSRSGCSVPTIRYYEKIDLLPSPGRASNGHRYYREDDVKRLTFIRRCRHFGFPIEEVRAMVSLFEDGDRACVEVRDMAQARLDDVRAKLDEMRQLEASLAAVVCNCDAACSAGLTSECVIIDELCLPDDTAAPKNAAACCAPPLVKQTAQDSVLASIQLKRPG